MESLLTIIGSIASIGGAIWACYEAKNAANSATKAEKVRDEMIHRRKMVEVTQVHAETKRILKVVSKVGPSCNSTLIRGVNCADIAKDVEEYSRFINERNGVKSTVDPCSKLIRVKSRLDPLTPDPLTPHECNLEVPSYGTNSCCQ